MTARNEIWRGEGLVELSTVELLKSSFDCTTLSFNPKFHSTRRTILGMFLFYCTRLKVVSEREKNGRPKDAHKLFYIFLTFCAPYNFKLTAKVAIRTKKRVFIGCHIKFYAVIYDFIERTSGWSRKEKHKSAREGEFLIYLLFLWIIKVDVKEDFNGKGKKCFYMNKHWRLLVIKSSLLLSSPNKNNAKSQ